MDVDWPDDPGQMCRPIRLGVLVLMGAMALASPARAARLDADAIRAKVAPAVCTVTAENTWGVPVSITSGFLLGDGRFVVTDLGAVARPGVEEASIRFEGGRTLTASRFGLADVSLGLVALRVDGKAGRPGLALGKQVPSLDGGTQVGIVGWQWGRDVEAAVGRLWGGPSVVDVARRAGIPPPATAECFLRLAGGALEAASGAPVVDRRGTVLAVYLEVAASGVGVPLAMPACSLRQSLLAAEPNLKPLSALPKARWPVRVLRVAGKPPKPAGFENARRRIREAMVCSRCGGRGRVRVDVADEVSAETVLCPRCHGEGVALESGVYELLATWAEEGTRAVWSPEPVGRVHTAARAAGREMLARLAKAGRHFRSAYAEKTSQDIDRLGHPVPRGVVLYAVVRETISGPDGRYVILEPVNTSNVVAVRLQDLMGRDDRRGPGGVGRRPRKRSWMILAGAVLSRFSGGRYRGVYVLPFEWTGCPTPGPVPGRDR